MSDNIYTACIEPWHIDHVANNMRASDVAEILASGGRDPHESLICSLSCSDEAGVLMKGSEPIALFGVGRVFDIGCPWLLGTDEISMHKKSFLVESKKFIDEAAKKYRCLVNYVHSDNSSSIRWLQWLGFYINEPVRYGLKGELFHLFEMRTKRV